MQLTDISSAAYVSWRKADLARAEEILSSEIERSSGPLHYHLSNRAFVRARQKQLDGALDDAQAVTRIRIPTVTLADAQCHKVALAPCQTIPYSPPCKERCTVWSGTV